MLQLLVLGNGRLGSAIGAAARDAGWPAPTIFGRPGPGGHDPGALAGAEVVVDASTGSAVAGHVADGVAAGQRRFLLAATGWEEDVARVRSLLLQHDAAAVVAPNLSIGAALFLRLAEVAAAWYARVDGFEPFVVERHRREKVDRPSGTARQLARRILAADPGRERLEVQSVRAGSSPGEHLVGFDAPGETVELRLTARDRSAYAAGALAAAAWLAGEPRAPGLHPFDAVVDDLLAANPVLVPA